MGEGKKTSLVCQVIIIKFIPVKKKEKEKNKKQKNKNKNKNECRLKSDYISDFAVTAVILNQSNIYRSDIFQHIE